MYLHSSDPRAPVPSRVRSCELPFLAAKAMDLLGPRSRSLELELVDEPPAVLADPEVVASALAHLIDGEPSLLRAYAVPGGVELCVIDVPSTASGGYAAARELLRKHGSELEQVELGRSSLTFRFRLAAAS